MLDSFKYSIKTFNKWFNDKRSAIIREEGKNKYSEYTRVIFKTYLTAKNQEFLDTLKDEKRKWSNGKCPSTYTYRDVMKVAMKTYNNLKSSKEWEVTKKETEEEAKFLALCAEVEELKRKSCAAVQNQPKNKNNGSENQPSKYAWKFERKEGQNELVKDGRTFKWCTKDCHKKPQ